ncbi:MAG: NAD(P)H-quinone oxidoreductase [Gammaproteobacteria bacterium]|nr:NAD(P)H-quinone oxidoreductase [Gammaproteobacteria bacterium]
MYAISIENDNLVWAETDDPELEIGQVRIRVHATALNRADLVQREGGYPPPPGASPILGLECAGEIMEVGEGVSSFQVGDAVCALLAGGGYAEQVVVPAGQVLPVPSGLSMAEAASLPEVFATAYLNLYMEAGLQRTERVLVHAAASGVGTAAIQMCVATNNPVFVTAGSDEKVEQCIALGADAGWNRKAGSFLEAVTRWGEVDVALDPVGANYLADNLACMAVDGRLALIGLLGGAQTDINLGALLMKRVRLIGSTLRARSVGYKSRVMEGLRENVWPEIEAGNIKPVVHAVLPIAQAGQAHALMAADENFGKIVLSVG